MRIRINPYKQGSRSAKALAVGLGGSVLKKEGSSYEPRTGDVVVNWGISGDIAGPRILNPTETVRLASNKREAFKLLLGAEVSIPRFWTNQGEIPDDAFPIVARCKLSGHSGDGIVMCSTREDLVSAPLYVEYVKKQDEYRVHIIGQAVIAIQRKARDRSNPNPNWQVRNHKNGFIFVREGFTCPERVIEEAKKSITALGLDFGAVDVVWNHKSSRAFVLEVNTAPGLEGQTVNDYVEGFRNYLQVQG